MSTLRDYITEHYGGKLDTGKHGCPDGAACVLEAVSAWRGMAWTDDPELVGLPDFRALNDITGVDPAHRAARMCELVDAYDGWDIWPAARRRAAAEHIVRLTVQRIIAELPGLSDSVREQCRAAQTMVECAAAAAAEAAVASAARAAGNAAAAGAAMAAAAAEKIADPLGIFNAACDLWLEAAQPPPPAQQEAPHD